MAGPTSGGTVLGLSSSYRGRLAPSPTGHLHLGHARTFWVAQERARRGSGALVLRIEDLDTARCRSEFFQAALEDLKWFGFEWQEGPDRGGRFAPYVQSARLHLYRAALDRLIERGHLYPCTCSRKDIRQALAAPHEDSDEPRYPGTCRNKRLEAGSAPRLTWRFRVSDDETVTFADGCQGHQVSIAGRDFGDFVVWRRDNLPAYQLAVVVDDAAMGITEVVRGADLLRSTARQLLLYRALDLKPPAFFHCPLVTDINGVRLAKRHDALSLRSLRARGAVPEKLRDEWGRSIAVEAGLAWDAGR